MGHSLLYLTNNHSWPMFTFEKQGPKKKKKNSCHLYSASQMTYKKNPR